MSFVLGAKLRELRVERGQSLQQVADAVSASKAHLWEVETGKTQNPSVDLVRRLADHFGVTVGWLVGDRPDPAVLDDRAAALYRSVRSLPDEDFELLETIIDGMKKRRSAET